MNLKCDIEPEVMKKLALLNETPIRNPINEQTGLMAFLKEAQELGGAVTTQNNRRHNGWMNTIQSIFMIRRKEHSPMFSTFATIMLLVSLLLGGSGITVAAAQNSQPDQPLYETKLWSEDLRLNLTSDPLTLAQLSLDYANLRSEEIQKMFESGSIPSETVQTRFKNQVERTLEFSQNLPTEQAIQALQQIQSRMQTQQQALLHVQTNGSPVAEAALIRTRQMIQDRLKLVEEGLSERLELREQNHEQEQLREKDQQKTSSPDTQSTQVVPGVGNGKPEQVSTPESKNGLNPDLTSEPKGIADPGLGNGSGSQSTPQQQSQSTQSDFGKTKSGSSNGSSNGSDNASDNGSSNGSGGKH